MQTCKDAAHWRLQCIRNQVEGEGGVEAANVLLRVAVGEVAALLGMPTGEGVWKLKSIATQCWPFDRE
jgi:hypothetical protein